jgi:Saxitoxin biosynthesis operon protein SxtJ
MKLRFKEDPGIWRNQALLSALGFAILGSVLLWRRILPVKVWCAVLVILGITALCALLKPRWFRGYYRLSVRIGFALSQFIGRLILMLFFIFILTPVGLVLRLAGKDALQLKRPRDVKTYWHQAKDCSPLDRLF